MSAGKGDRDRTTDKKAYDECPLWNNWKTKAKNQRIFDENEHLIEESNVEIVGDLFRVARYFDDHWEAWVSEPTSKEEAESLLNNFKPGHYVSYDVRRVKPTKTVEVKGE